MHPVSAAGNVKSVSVVDCNSSGLGHHDLCLQLVLKDGTTKLTGLDRVPESAHGYVGYLCDGSGNQESGSRISMTKYDEMANVSLNSSTCHMTICCQSLAQLKCAIFLELLGCHL